MTSAARIEDEFHEIRREGATIIRDIARRESAKVISIYGVIKPRHVYNLREEVGQPEIGWPHFMMLARQYPELRAAVVKWLELDTQHDPRAADLLKQVIAYAKSLPEAGDMEVA